MTYRTLDRLQRFDERSRAFPVRTLLPNQIGRSYTWACNTWLDQGSEGACVLFAWGHEAAARPVILPYTDAQAFRFYEETLPRDGFPMPHEGTSVLAGAQTMQLHKYLDEYRWGFGLRDVVLAIGYKGPGVFGLDWYNGMFKPDAQGFLRLTDGIAGGHAILGNRVVLRWKPETLTAEKKSDEWWDYLDLDESFIGVHNSWGKDWGQFGNAKISFTDLDKLLNDGGEFCIPVRRGHGEV